MTSFVNDIQRLRSASSLADIQKIVRGYSAEAPAGSQGGILYSGRVGEVRAEIIALEIADITGQPIINRTPRAVFLSTAERDIKSAATRIYREQGLSRTAAMDLATSFLYGQNNAPIHGPTSLDGCLWGETSREFAGSLRGDISLIASQAEFGRVFAAAETPAALENGNIMSIGGHSTDALRKLARHGEASEILAYTQSRFIKAAANGIFVSPQNAGPELSKIVISKEVAASLGLDTKAFFFTADLEAAGLRRISLTSTAPPKVLGMPPMQSTSLPATRAASVIDVEAGQYLRMAATKSLSAGALAFFAYDAYTTAKQYQTLSAQSNPFGADALLRRYEGRTAGGAIGGIGAGAAYGFVAGAETGPGALVTGVVGSVVGAFEGDRLAVTITEHKVNHQTGADGVTYLYEGGVWKHTHYRLDPDGSAVPNPYGAPSMQAAVTTAPAEQVAQLDYQRMTAITSLALANPATQDTRLIELDGIRWHATRTGWAQTVELPGLPNNSFGIPAFTTVDRPADAQTAKALDQLAANREFNNTHYAEAVANAYVMDYYGKGWSETGPLPEVVTQALGLASEKHITDPQTGHAWNADGHGHFSREETRLIGRVVIHETHGASGEELSRLSQLQQSAVRANADYGRQLIAQKYEEWQATQLHAPIERGAIGPDHHPAPAESVPTSPDPTSASAHMAPPITPASSARAMFDALVAAARTMDIDTMRSIGQQYLQSEQGQAWLAAGQQLNQQLAQQAEREAQVRQAVAMQR